jgi:hypothetical protein
MKLALPASGSGTLRSFVVTVEGLVNPRRPK